MHDGKEYKVNLQYTLIYISIGNSMVSSAIWKKHARVSFSKTINLKSLKKHNFFQTIQSTFDVENK